MRSRIGAIALAVTAAVAMCAAPTSAATDAQALSGPTAKYYGYITPVIVVSKGGALTYTNLDVERHNVVQDVETDGVKGSSKRPWCKQFPAGKCPVFYSPLIGFGDSEPVDGLQYVKPGTVYTFYCTQHHGMKGKLVVQP